MLNVDQERGVEGAIGPSERAVGRRTSERGGGGKREETGRC
jgi:hypothetical protein